MKKTNKKRVGKVTFLVVSRLAIISLMVSLFVVVPSVTYVYSNGQQRLKDELFGKTASYQGILKLWNVDTFEGGSGSRSEYLEKICVNFEKKNKGVFIKVENLTVDQMIANISIGEFPDLFSFGTGVAGYLKDKMIELDNNFSKKLLSNFYSAGLDGSRLKAVAWSYGGYALISSTDRIENAGKNVDVNLNNLAFELSYDKQYKKQTKHINSLTFGANEYVNALNVFSRHFRNQSIVDLANSGVVDSLYNKQTPYLAYTNFILKKSSMLLGSQRDIHRIQSKVMAGVEIDCLITPLAEFTDLVSYISVLDNSNKNIIKVCKEFISFLLSKESQLKLESIGMLSPVGVKLYKDGGMKELEMAINEHTKVANIF